MHFKILSLALFVVGMSDTINCQGNRIVYPDEVPDLVSRLGITNGIRTRFNFPNNQNTCITQDGGQQGTCVTLRECPELLDFIAENGIRTNADIRFLRNRICRFQSNTVVLCCLSKTSGNTPTPTTVTIGTPPSRVTLPSMDECGATISKNRITDGEEIPHGAHPWLAAIGYPRTDQSFRVLCGGTLITKKHVLTAAHCFIRVPGLRPLTHVRLGEHSLSKNTESPAPITLLIADRKSPGYDRISHINDLELVVLERDVTFTSFIQPACLPFGFESRIFNNEEMVIVGWGDTFFRDTSGSDVPLQAKINVVPKPECREDYRSEPQVPLDNTQLCAGKGSRDACQGDSGGPLLYRNPRFFIMGVVSFGVECANPNFPGVYTYIPEFVKWIKDNL